MEFIKLLGKKSMSDRERAYRDIFYSVHRKTAAPAESKPMNLHIDIASIVRILAYSSMFYSLYLGISLLLITEVFTMFKLNLGE